jgi:formate hydrogenlyase transcriptional activator
MMADAETDRQEALRQYAVVDTPRERAFDQLAGFASEICRTPFAAISLIDADREWFKATVGLSVAEVPRAMSVGAETIQQQDVLVVTDALNDPRFRHTFFVAGEPHIRFYAGAPLTTPAGHSLGTICVMDVEPRALTPQQAAALLALGHQVMSQLELRRLEADGRTADQELKSLLDVNIAVGRHLDRDELFGAIASSLRTIVETDRFGIEMPIAGNRLQGHILAAGGTGARPTQPTVLPVEGTVCHWVMESRRWLVVPSRDELRERFPVTFDQMQRNGMESLCTLPLTTGDRCLGALFFMAARQGAYQRLRRGSCEQIASAVAVALEHCLAHEELRRLRDRLQTENLYLQEEIQTQHNFSEIVGNSPALLTALGRVERVAATDTTVLILGETGSGKELFARAVHSRSRRADRPLVKVNCGAIAPGLIESELFGHVKGAFTGAVDKRVGRFEVAHGGTILLDEIGEMPLDAQVKLLRVLQEQEFEVVGSSRTVRVDVRVIASTNRNLEHAVRAGTFRADLLYRLNVFPIEVPPLRARPSDIPLLVALFIGALTRKLGKPLQGFTTSAMDRLIAYDWPGNVRELSNVVERAAILARGPVLDLEDWPLAAPETHVERSGPSREAEALDTVGEAAPSERRIIEAALAESRGRVSGPSGAAARLRIPPSTLEHRIRTLHIDKRRFKFG